MRCFLPVPHAAAVSVAGTPHHTFKSASGRGPRRVHHPGGVPGADGDGAAQPPHRHHERRCRPRLRWGAPLCSATAITPSLVSPRALSGVGAQSRGSTHAGTFSGSIACVCGRGRSAYHPCCLTRRGCAASGIAHPLGFLDRWSCAASWGRCVGCGACAGSRFFAQAVHSRPAQLACCFWCCQPVGLSCAERVATMGGCG